MSNYITDSELSQIEGISEKYSNNSFSYVDKNSIEDIEIEGIDFSEGISDLHEKLEAMSQEQIREYAQENMGEFLPAIGAALTAVLPMLKAALPTILPMLAQALPSVLQTAGGLVKGFAGQPSPVQQTVQRPRPRQTSPPPYNQGTGASGGDSLNQTLQALLGLLQNPQIISALSNLANGVMANIQAPGGINVPASNILSVVSQLSGQAASQVSPGSQAVTESSFPDYVFNDDGKLLIDPYNPVQHAELLTEVIG